MTQLSADAQTITRQISDEVYKALGFSINTWWRGIFDPLVNRPCAAFAEICAYFDHTVANCGFREAARQILPRFVGNIRINGIENIPESGPLLITSNHPGTYDSLVIASNIPRDDLKIVAGNILFLKNMPATQNHMIHTTLDTGDRMIVIRKGLRHLKAGGSLLIFGSGGIDPEPVYMPGAEDEIERWSPSIELFMEKVPGIKTLTTIVSGVLSPRYINHPFIFFKKMRRDRQRISEFMQVIHQMLSPGKLLLSPRVSFSEPISPPEVHENGETFPILKSIIERAKQLLADHLATEPDQPYPEENRSLGYQGQR
jgi:hypothetical protein